jgi:hypothetical protein
MNKSIEFGSDNIVCAFLKNDIHHSFRSIQSEQVRIFTSNENYVGALKISEGKNAFYVWIDWAKVRINNATDRFIIEVSYKSKTIKGLECEIRVNFPLSSPKLHINPLQVNNLIWGDDKECLLIDLTYGDSDKEKWMYDTQQCNVIIKDITDDFSASEDSFTIYVCESKRISFKYKYSGHINDNVTKNLHVTINENKYKYQITFKPLQPQLKAIRKLCTKKVPLGTGDIKVCEVSVDKHSPFAADIVRARLMIDCSINNLFSLIQTANKWDIIFRSSNMKKLPSEPIDVSLRVNSDNAGSADVEGFTLTDDNHVVDNKSVCLMLQQMLQVSQKNEIIIYRGTSECSLADFIIRNNGGFSINNVQIKITCPNGNAFFSNGDNPFFINTLASNSEKLFQIKVHVSGESLSELYVNISVEADYSEPQQFTFTFPVKTKKPATLFIEPIKDTAQQIFFDENYENKSCLQLLLKNRIETNVDVRGISKLYLTDIAFDAPFSIKSIKSRSLVVLEPGQSCICDLVLTGSIHEFESNDEGFRVAYKYGGNTFNEIVVNAVNKVYREYRPKINALKPTFPLPTEGRIIKIATFELKEFNINSSFSRINQRIAVDAPFCFDGNPNVKVKKISSEGLIDLYLDVSSKFGNAINIRNNETPILLQWSYSDDVPGGTIPLKTSLDLRPIDLGAKMNVHFEKQPDDKYSEERANCQLEVFYTNGDLNGIKRQLGTFVIVNETQYQWNDESVKIENAYIAITSQRLQGGLFFNFVNRNHNINGNIEIPNGGEAQRYPVMLDIKKWKDKNCPCDLYIYLQSGNETLFEIHVIMHEIVNDGIYSLDLGTTGIVVAKEYEGQIDLVPLRDQPSKNLRIEEDDEILSSIVIMKPAQGDEKGILELAPPTTDYLGGSDNFVIVPSKFIIGQSHIPFLRIPDGNRIVDAFGEADIDLTANNVSNSIVGNLYKHIFKLFPDGENNNVRKLVATYPNTYTPEYIKEMREIMQNSLNLAQENVEFVPESDAVAAYYFDKRINSNDPFTENDENILIYDMGAGTLDVSFVKIHRVNDRIVASLENKIGVPVAGNYLDYLLFKSLKESKLLTKKAIRMEEGKQMKKIITYFKLTFPDLDEMDNVVDINETSMQQYQDYLVVGIKDKKYNEVFKNNIDNYLEICTKKVFELLNENRVDRIVFSGRASQFKPIRKKVVEYFGGVDNVKVEELETMGGNLKTCVAIGALKYQQYFNCNHFYGIENRNQYAKIGVVYYKMNSAHTQNNVAYKILVDPLTENWDDAKFLNGTRCREFQFDGELSDVVNGSYIYYIQSMLDENDVISLYQGVFANEENARQNILWGLVNELFRVRVNSPMGNVSVALYIDENSTITKRRIGNTDFDNVHVLENIENNDLYRNSMWPFI